MPLIMANIISRKFSNILPGLCLKDLTPKILIPGNMPKLKNLSCYRV